MEFGPLRFDRFLLDPSNRRLSRDGVPVKVSGRYFDALALLVRERGRLVTKARFLEEVWRGVPVTDEALTQCIRTLRRKLGDAAAQPRFIETVPKHGYRFMAPVEAATEPRERSSGGTPAKANVSEPAGQLGSAPLLGHARSFSWRHFLLLGAAGVVGAGAAGVVGGLLYGIAEASQPLGAGMGAASVLLVLTAPTVLVALVGGAGVSFGIAAGLASGRSWGWSVLGGSLGGLVVGAVAKLLGLDAFTLLFGRSPGDITGAAEGAALGGAVGFGAWLASRAAGPLSLRRIATGAGAVGAVGVVIPLFGGRLMGGSLDLLIRHFPDSRLRLDGTGGLFGEEGFGPITQAATGAVEGLLFGGGIVVAMLLAQRHLARCRDQTPP